MVCLLMVTQSVMAVEVKGLFEVNVMTQSQSREDRNLALREGLSIVFKRFLPSEAMANNKLITDALKEAASYVDQYQYALMSTESAASDSRLMRASFDENRVMTLMRRSGLPLWNEMRDEVLVWLVVEENGKRHVFDAAEEWSLQQQLQKTADLKGIPLLFPLMDLEEKQTVTVKDILSAYSGKLMIASKRYDLTSVLSGKLVKKGRCWQSEWTLNFNGKIKQWNVPCLAIKENLAGSFDEVFTMLSAFYAVESSGEDASEIGVEALRMKISGLKTKKSRDAIQTYLAELLNVKSVDATPTKKRGQCIFTVKYSGSRTDLEDQLILGRKLREKGLSGRDNSVVYELVK